MKDLGVWLSPWEQKAAIEMLLRHGLIKFDNKRKLPLKKGGFTDIYITLRDARKAPLAISSISELYSNALRRVNPDVFVEVPDSVSCFAGPISMNAHLPILTIREQEKKGRVSNANIIGEARFNDTACIIDDVITDGESKIVPYQQCLKMGLEMGPMIVLVDRQQGWKKKFADNNIDLSVWSGMTLHDVRKYLINKGLMERCDKDMEEDNPLIIALDGKNWEDILPIIDELRTTGCIFKVNDLLFDKGFENLIPDLNVYGRVMADIKGHDIKNTLENITKRLLKYPPWAVTVHASGGEEMLKAVVNVLKDTDTKVLAVTVLTSINEKTSQEVYHRLPLEQVEDLAEIANRAGVDGFVCSPEETFTLKNKYPDKIVANPGIRSEGVRQGDQERISTPSGALQNGADYLVMGRQITQDAPEPVKEVLRLLKEEIKVI
jgi:orotidine-5'-phosphate decarboxylase